MPDPLKYDNKEDFVKACVPVVMGEGKTQDEALGQCYGMWENKNKATNKENNIIDKSEKMKIETTDINDIEIAKVGNYNASTGDIVITEKMYNDFLTNFQNKITNPYLNLDHNDKMTDKVKEALKILRLGSVKDLYKKGKSLYASFKDVPVKIADLIKSGLMTQRSIEFSKKFKRMDTIYDNVLRGVSFFGKAEPAIPGLEDYVDIFAQVQEDENEVISIMKNSTKEIKGMEIEKKEYEELVKAKAEKELNEIKLSAEISTKEKMQVEYKNSIEKLQNELSKEKQKVEKLEKEKADVEKMKADYEAEKETDLQKEAGKYINDIIGKKKILPKYKDKYVADYVRCSKESEESLKLFREDVESRGDVIDLSAKIDPSLQTINAEMEKLTVDDPEKVSEYMNELNDRIEAQMKKLKLQGVDGDLYQKARSIVMGE